MKVNAFDSKGNKIDEIELKDAVFGVKPNREVLGQYIRVYLSNQRQGTSSTKTRGEVSGGGKKPWKQKGTGRARVGSTRIPLWRHGGISHGPRPRNWRLEMPKRMRRLANLSALSSKSMENKIVVVENLEMGKPSTKKFSQILKNMKLEGKILFVFDKADENVVKSLSNLPGVSYTLVSGLNAYDILNSDRIVFLKKAVSSLEKKYQ